MKTPLTEKLAATFKKLHNLMENPEMGLASWGMAVANNMEIITNWWEGNYEKETTNETERNQNEGSPDMGTGPKNSCRT